MSGQTQFNSDLAGAEHWLMADESGSIDIRTRRDFGEHVKAAVANAETSIHAKYGEAATLPIWHRMSMSVNDQSEALQILPPMNASLEDKVTLLRCTPADVGNDRTATWTAATREIPQLLGMLRTIRIPKAERHDRYAVRAFHNPDLFEALADYSPEARLLDLIDEIIFSKGRDPWRGSAIELEKQLRSSAFSWAVDKLLSFGSACGSYLARIQNRHPERVSGCKNEGKTVWTIQPPALRPEN